MIQRKNVRKRISRLNLFQAAFEPLTRCNAIWFMRHQREFMTKIEQTRIMSFESIKLMIFMPCLYKQEHFYCEPIGICSFEFNCDFFFIRWTMQTFEHSKTIRWIFHLLFLMLIMHSYKLNLPKNKIMRFILIEILVSRKLFLLSETTS